MKLAITTEKENYSVYTRMSKEAFSQLIGSGKSMIRIPTDECVFYLNLNYVISMRCYDV